MREVIIEVVAFPTYYIHRLKGVDYQGI